MLDSRTTSKMDALKNHGDDGSLDSGSSTNGRSRRTGEKYGLRPRTIIKRLQQERVRQEVPVKRVRTKSRPAPLSKYRRKTANARERHRMKEINNAFEMLRKVLPDAMDIQAAASSCSMTKITTLRLAVNYIRALSEVLADDNDMDLCSVQNSLQNSIENTLKSSFPHSFHTSGTHVMHPMVGIPYEAAIPNFSHHYVSQFQQFPDLCTAANTDSSNSSSFSASRGSLGSASDLEELLSDDSGLLEDNLDVFNDIPTLSVADPFDILLVAEKDTLSFANAM